MNRQLLLVVFVALPMLVNCRPTHCERWKGDSEFRCGKDGYGADNVHIRNVSNKNIAFKIGKWISECGRPGVNYSNEAKNLSPGGSMDEHFSEVKNGSCNELFIYECSRDGQRVNCLDIISVYPK